MYSQTNKYNTDFSSVSTDTLKATDVQRANFNAEQTIPAYIKNSVTNVISNIRGTVSTLELSDILSVVLTEYSTNCTNLYTDMYNEYKKHTPLDNFMKEILWSHIGLSAIIESSEQQIRVLEQRGVSNVSESLKIALLNQKLRTLSYNGFISVEEFFLIKHESKNINFKEESVFTYQNVTYKILNDTLLISAMDQLERALTVIDFIKMPSISFDIRFDFKKKSFPVPLLRSKDYKIFDVHRIFNSRKTESYYDIREFAPLSPFHSEKKLYNKHYTCDMPRIKFS